MAEPKPAPIDMPRPLFELKGPLSRIDLSAWLAGFSFMIGMCVVGSHRLALDLATGGKALMAIGISFGIFLVTVLIIQRHMRFKLTDSTFGKPQHLTTDGIFKYSRNPIYVAVFLPLAAIAMLSPLAAIIALIFYIIAMNYTVIRIEERDLANTFGQEFLDYMKRTPRWLF